MAWLRLLKVLTSAMFKACPHPVAYAKLSRRRGCWTARWRERQVSRDTFRHHDASVSIHQRPSRSQICSVHLRMEASKRLPTGASIFTG